MRFYNLRDNILKRIGIGKRLRNVCLWYIISLMISVRKHTLTSASALSGLGKPAFCRFLKEHYGTCAYTLESLSKKEARRFSEVLKKSASLPWRIFIVIDSTIQHRSSLKPENVQRFNHGRGYVIGHQWTNIILILDGIIIPMPPIPFYTKKYCRENNLKYRTEHENLIEYISSLNLKEYIGVHQEKDVVVLTDSGYDDRSIQNAVTKKHWHFICALKSSRGVKSESEYVKNPKSSGWNRVSEFFRNHRRIRWETVRIFTEGPKRKRKDFRIRHADIFLKSVGKVRAVCSEFKGRRKGSRKYLACSDLKAAPRQILIGYRMRWKVEIFHKMVKMYLGFEDIATAHFSSVISHVYLVYCAYILFHSDIEGFGGKKTLPDKQVMVGKILENKKTALDIQELTKIGGAKRYKDKLKSVLAV